MSAKEIKKTIQEMPENEIPEPVAPWNWSSIPDYGPLKNYQHAASFLLIGIGMTGLYEFTSYFDQIPRELAYPLIWVFIFLRMLGKLGPDQLTPEEEQALREKEDERAFKEQLKEIENEGDSDDEETKESNGKLKNSPESKEKKTQ